MTIAPSLLQKLKKKPAIGTAGTVDPNGNDAIIRLIPSDWGSSSTGVKENEETGASESACTGSGK